MPAGQIDDHYVQAARFTGGSVSGRIEVGGKPMAGIRVGVMPTRALRLLRGLTDSSDRVSPFWLWQVTAASTTNPQGEFRLERLIQGNYVIVARIPGMRILEGTPTPFIEITPESPDVKIGTVSLHNSTNDR